MLVFFAKWFAIFAHSSIRQKRRYTGEPYWKHPRDIVEHLKRNGIKDPAILAAAWLHDTVEDTWVKHWMIRMLFGAKVSEYVIGLTDVTTLADGNRKVRKAIERDRLAQTCAAVQTVKLADLYSNSLSILVYDRRFAETAYLGEVIELVNVLTKADDSIRNELTALLAIQETIGTS